tara:strand:- start:47 stop:304 length:258 start_codon:yes stop_codon:yes gene_type:complete
MSVLSQVLFKLEQLVPVDKVNILTTIKRFRTKLAYTAPELHGALWHDVFEEIIIELISPHDSEPWTDPIHELWQKNVPLQKTRQP